MDELRTKIDHELEHAKRSRESGNEGKARVCARRAAGYALEAYLLSTFDRNPSKNAYLNLKWFAERKTVPSNLRAAAKRLSTHVGKNHEIPFDEDPLDDARLLIEALLNPQDK